MPEQNSISSEISALLAVSERQQEEAGYLHTLREILQQPGTWLDTCERLIEHKAALESKLAGIAALVLTGSGSSQFAGECVRAVLQQELGIPTQAVAGGALLTSGDHGLPPGRPALVVSLARSGDSPESGAAVSLFLEFESQVRHVILTCNGEGSLAKTERRGDRLHAVVLDGRTNDRSLVMTSSFTNLALAARFLGLTAAPQRYRAICHGLSSLAGLLLHEPADAIARLARREFRRAVFLGSGPQLGAAREAALKMLEMTGGSVATMAETYLGLRHGPMSFIHSDTLIVCFLSFDATMAKYECDLVRELDRKKLGCGKLLVGEYIPGDLVGAGDIVIDLPGMSEMGDENTPVLHVMTGQLLAFFRCLADGLKPDSPSEDGVIHRVVEGFPVHRHAGSVEV